MGKKTKTPSAPDYSGIAQQQAEQAKQAWNTQLQANRPNQSNQFGSSTWTQDDQGNWSQNTQLNQPQQDIFNQQQSNQQQIANMAGGMLGGFNTSQIDLSKAPALPSGPVDYSSLGAIPQVGQYDQRATDLYRQLGQPDLDRAQAARRASLAARGISDVTSRAGTNMEAQLADQTNRFGMEAAQRGIQQGNTMFGQGMQGYQQGAQNLNNQFNQGMGLNQQGVSNILQERTANLGQLSGLMGLGQSMGVPQFENFNAAGAYQTPDLMGAANSQYGANLDKTNASNADKSNTMKTVGTVASIAATAF